ncbi:MAG: hypothetical protein ACK55Z_32870, partial [bacterium]
MEWEHQRGQERGLLQEELRKRKEEIAAVHSAADALQLTLMAVEDEAIVAIKVLEKEVEKLQQQKLASRASVEDLETQLRLVRNNGEDGLRYASYTYTCM